MAYNNKSVGPLKISEASYNKQNRKMRKENPGMGSKLTSGTSPRRISFACRFGSMQGDMKDKDGSPSKLAKALKKWGFGSKEYKEHLALKEKGYDHSPYKKKKKCNCWKGYERVPGTKPCTNKSCRKKR